KTAALKVLKSIRVTRCGNRYEVRRPGRDPVRARLPEGPTRAAIIAEVTRQQTKSVSRPKMTFGRSRRANVGAASSVGRPYPRGCRLSHRACCGVGLLSANREIMRRFGPTFSRSNKCVGRCECPK